MSSIPFRLSLLVCALGLAATVGAQEQQQQDDKAPPPAPKRQQQQRPAPNQLERVEVDGRPTDEAVRRASTASKIIISREEIERYGDSTVGEVLKRLPGVTTGGRPGRGGEVRMRGMGSGYTQILVNGERMPPGFSLDQLPPDQIERIEVMRAPTAEHGARAIAGTINIVLREALQKYSNDLRLAVSEERGQLRPNIGWTRNDKFGDNGGAYNLTVNATRNQRYDDVRPNSDTVVPSRGVSSHTETVGQNQAANESLNMNGRVQWRLGPGGDQFSLQPFFVTSKSHSSNDFHQTQSWCDTNPDPDADPGTLIQCQQFDHAVTQSDSRFTMARLHSQWTQHLAPQTKMEVRAAFGGARGSGHSFRQEYLDDAPSRNQDDTTHTRDGSWSLVGKLSQQMANEHSLVGGLEAEGTSRNSTRITLQNGLPRPQLADFGDNVAADTLRLAWYGQDEWSVGKQWSFYAGLRGESIATHSTAASYEVRNNSTVWTPLLHGVYRFDENSRDQIRASLTRSYRAPQLNDLTAPASINAQYPCVGNALCGPNEANAPDRQGNPGLKPELATGVELGYENYLSKGGIVSANVFYRHIDNLIRSETMLETVSWASTQRWVSRPRNIGTAKTYGIELEAKFRLDQFIEAALPINVRSNLSLFHSAVDGIPGPYNKLDQQPRYTGNLGGDYRLKSLPLTLGASLNYTPASLIQQTPLQLNSSSKKSVLDAFALWNFNMNTALRLSATNLTTLDYATGSVITTQYKTINSESNGRTFVLWAARLEIKL
ncbi:TonB-dependent siderophore receptor [Pelomonas sp. KK5]|uniref:TonB-dependent receptor plug domain-containing protein n=1 Tax=Pelomonas sp. KK5 TaxID=1855730 RepID=UPI00097C5A86|nr:TonB-dependent receptor [Pelomonas sp. KK5]